MPKYTHIIWDWNGTLLDDVYLCMQTINTMLKKRDLPTLDSVEDYHKVFGFPVRDYYLRVGFDFDQEPFKDLAVEYIELYHGKTADALLFPDAEKILAGFQKDGIHQIILSASESRNLMLQMKPFGIEKYFDEILGISNIYAASKIDIGNDYIKRANPDKTVLIGDTVHDKEVADALGVDCILIANGHQSKEVLRSRGGIVLHHLVEITNFLL